MKSRGMPFGRAVTVMAAAIGVAGTGAAAATDQEDGGWTARKCSLYEVSVRDAISLQGSEGLRMEFLTENQVFIDEGCTAKAEICPMTDEEWRLAETLLKMTVNEGMASTFVPFGCP
ncbi:MULTISPECIES: hypothetical protein [Roseovarius]|uniref:hypothetical protein n=1 Tax=Roseovarius TaxID=74030 RepID=UPI00273DF678|nr:MULTISPECIES: hypothetical protein [unclassified Roseovarius]